MAKTSLISVYADPGARFRLCSRLQPRTESRLEYGVGHISSGKSTLRPKAEGLFHGQLDPVAYKQRNHIERMFCRLEDFRRIATRYDKLAANFATAVAIAAIVIWWA